MFGSINRILKLSEPKTEPKTEIFFGNRTDFFEKFVQLTIFLVRLFRFLVSDLFVHP